MNMLLESVLDNLEAFELLVGGALATLAYVVIGFGYVFLAAWGDKRDERRNRRWSKLIAYLKSRSDVPADVVETVIRDHAPPGTDTSGKEKL